MMIHIYTLSSHDSQSSELTILLELHELRPHNYLFINSYTDTWYDYDMIMNKTKFRASFQSCFSCSSTAVINIISENCFFFSLTDPYIGDSGAKLTLFVLKWFFNLKNILFDNILDMV